MFIIVIEYLIDINNLYFNLRTKFNGSFSQAKHLKFPLQIFVFKLKIDLVTTITNQDIYEFINRLKKIVKYLLLTRVFFNISI